jgi:hypothetical protein
MTVLRSYVGGAWTEPAGGGRPVLDAVTGEEVARVVLESEGVDPRRRGATWTYLTTDRPFGNYTERILKALVAKLRK